jgi:hypothetical protein
MDNDLLHGSSAVGTLFRNLISGWEVGKIQQTVPLEFDGYGRGFNVVGNVLGTAGYHNNYESSLLTGFTNAMTSIYVLGWAFGVVGNVTPPPVNDPLVESTLLRWGNYDVVHGGVQWNSSEIPTTGVPFINGNPVPGNHNLPASFYLSAKPSWWPIAIPWPPIGPDVSGGNIAGVGGHANIIPAHACFHDTPFDPSYQTTYTVTGASWNSGQQLATITIGSHDLVSGDVITVSGINPPAYNGTFSVYAVTTTTISYDMPTNPGSYSSGGTFKYPNILNYDACNCYGTTSIANSPSTPVLIQGSLEKVSIGIYDIHGRLVKTITLNRGSGTSESEVTAKWDGTDEQGKKLTNGVYFVKGMSGGKQQVSRLLLLLGHLYRFSSVGGKPGA